MAAAIGVENEVPDFRSIAFGGHAESIPAPMTLKFSLSVWGGGEDVTLFPKASLAWMQKTFV